jgi:hypothetical protein
VLGWVVLFRCLLLFLICFVSFGPFLCRLDAIDFVVKFYTKHVNVFRWDGIEYFGFIIWCGFGFF